MAGAEDAVGVSAELIVAAAGSAIAAAGAAIVYGAIARWSWLVDPAESDWPVYSQALLKKLLGKSGLIVVTYAQGVALGIAGAALVWAALGG